MHLIILEGFIKFLFCLIRLAYRPTAQLSVLAKQRVAAYSRPERCGIKCARYYRPMPATSSDFEWHHQRRAAPCYADPLTLFVSASISITYTSTRSCVVSLSGNRHLLRDTYKLFIHKLDINYLFKTRQDILNRFHWPKVGQAGNLICKYITPANKIKIAIFD